VIRDTAWFQEWEETWLRKEGTLPFERALEIFTSLWKEAQELGIFPLKNPLEGTEVDIRIAKILHTCSQNSSRF
jgi:hypothetical protein